MASKGKEVAGKGFSGKRKPDNGDKSGGRKRKNPGVLQFFDDVAAEVDDNDTSDDSDFDDDFMDDELDTGLKVKNEPGKAHHLPFLPKEEEMSEEELEKLLEERYKNGSGFVTYAEDDYETKRSVQRNILMPSAKDPTIWKVKCMVGRERHSAFCLMQKYIDMQSLGTKLQIISAFAVEHIKGFVYIEADKQFDVNEACKGLCSIYSSRVAAVPKNEISHLLSVRNKYNEISEGMWARVKNGKYKGDLAQVVAVNDSRKRATVKLIPRIDLQALTEKFGGGVTAKKTATPAPRLISSSELEEFQPVIQYRRDRDTGKIYEILDGLQLKDGYLYKKVSLDSLSFLGVMPSEDELQKFKPSKKDESNDLEWLSQLYGHRKKRTIKTDKGGGKGEGTSGSSMANSFELHDLVCFGRKDFGIIIGMEKDDSYKILKDGLEGPVVMTAEPHELKNGLFDKKFTALDQRMKPISVNDTVRVSEGPSKGRQGIVKQIYRGTVFLYGENKEENGCYFSTKSQMCEKVKLSNDASNEKGGESGAPGFEDFCSSPKSPLSPKKPWQARENNRDFNQGDKDGMFSIGQTLRIRVGPLKGYLCRVLAIRYSDITVKLDSQQRVLTVKCEHLSEVRGKSSAFSMSENPESSSIKPFDLLGTQGCSGDWMEGAGTSAEGDRWNAGGASAERSSWPAFPASGFSLQSEQSADPFGSTDNGPKKDLAASAWESKVTPNQNSSWGTAVADDKAVANSSQVGGWGSNTTAKTGFGSVASGSWGKAKLPSGDQEGSSKDAGDNWGKGKLKIGSSADSSNDVAASWDNNKSTNDNQEDPWKKAEDLDKGKNVIGNSTSSWNNATAGKNQLDSSGKGKDASEAGCWEKNKSSSSGGSGWNQQKSWDKEKDYVGGDGPTWGKVVESKGKGNDKGIQEDSLGKAAEKWGSKGGSSGIGADWRSSTAASENETRGWGNAGGSWAQAEAKNADQAKVVNGGQTENWGDKKNVGDNATGWGKGGNQDQTDNWSKPKAFSADGGSSWNKQDGGSSWNKQAGGSSWNKNDADQQESKLFDGGRGSGGRRGRGGNIGGRDQFGRGRSFGRGQSSGWNKEGQDNNWTGDGTSLGNPSGWNNDQSGDWGKAKAVDGGRRDDGYNKPNVSGEDNGSSWNKGWGGGKEMGESGDKWNSAKPFGGNKSSWNGDRAECQDGDKSYAGNQSSGNWNASKPSDGNSSSGWNKGSVTKEEPSGTGCDTKSSWNTPKGPQDKSSGWNQKPAENEKDGENKDQGDGWNSRKTSDGGSAAGWGQSTGWKSGKQDSNWGKQSNWNSGNAFSGNQSVAGGTANPTDTYGNRERGGGNWRGGKSFGEDQSSGWGRGKFADKEAGDSADFSNRSRGGFGGRGRSDRGGFGGRGGGFGGRSGSDRGGGFGGRGGPNRGGFGGRGRGRRDQSGGWNNNNDSGEDKPFGSWNTGGNTNGGEEWKGNDGAVSWNKGGGTDKGQWSGWNSGASSSKGTGETGNQASNWNSQGSGWNQQKGAVESVGANAQASGWNKGNGGTTADQAETWNNRSNDAGGGQSSGWNQSKDAKEGASGGVKPNDSWGGKAAASSWGKGSDGSGKGGW